MYAAIGMTSASAPEVREIVGPGPRPVRYDARAHGAKSKATKQSAPRGPRMNLMRGREVLSVNESAVLEDAQREADLALERSGLTGLTEPRLRLWGHNHY